MSFNQFCKQNSTNETVNKNIEINRDNSENIKDFYNKYKNYSNSELMQELLSTANEKKDKGEFDYNKLNESINSLCPFLTDDQQKNIKGILEKLK